MDIRIAGVALVGAALIASGCSGKSNPAATPSASAAPTSATVKAQAMSDEDQIRDVLTREGAAFSTFNFDKVAELTCPQFREQARSAAGAIPPMSMFPADAPASMGTQAFAGELGKQFAGASDQSLQAVADAVMRQDEAAYKAAMLDVVKQSMNVVLVQVDNIVITGDTATADAQLTQRMGQQPPEPKTSPATLARVDGKWLDCTPPAQP
jgi:hypothetical protein